MPIKRKPPFADFFFFRAQKPLCRSAFVSSAPLTFFFECLTFLFFSFERKCIPINPSCTTNRPRRRKGKKVPRLFVTANDHGTTHNGRTRKKNTDEFFSSLCRKNSARHFVFSDFLLFPFLPLDRMSHNRLQIHNSRINPLCITNAIPKGKKRDRLPCCRRSAPTIEART